MHPSFPFQSTIIQQMQDQYNHREFTPQVSPTLPGSHSKGRDITEPFSPCLLPNSHILYLHRYYNTATSVSTIPVYLTLGMFTHQKPWSICILAVTLLIKLLSYLHLRFLHDSLMTLKLNLLKFITTYSISYSS